MVNEAILKAPTTKRVILWDIGGTLLTVDSQKALKEFGYFNMFAYLMSYLLNKLYRLFNKQNDTVACAQNSVGFKQHLEDLFTCILAKIPSPLATPEYKHLQFNHTETPPIQRDYLLGKLTGHEALELIDEWISKHSDAFTDRFQKSVFRTACRLYFNNYDEMLTYTPLIKLFRRAYQATNAQGERLNTNIIVSNWPRDIHILKEQFSDIFKYSDAQIISGVEDLAKPHPAIFKRAREMYPEKQHLPWFLIDDQLENRQAAEQENIIPIDPKKAFAAFRKYGLLN